VPPAEEVQVVDDVPETIREEEPPMAEKPVSAPEPVSKKKKGKIVVEEVRQDPPVQLETASVVEAEPAKAPAPTPAPQVIEKKANKKGHESGKPSLVTANDLLAAVKRSQLNELEAQRMIDVLLNKQSGGGRGGAGDSGWVDAGKNSYSNEVMLITWNLAHQSLFLVEERSTSVGRKVGSVGGGDREDHELDKQVDHAQAGAEQEQGRGKKACVRAYICPHKRKLGGEKEIFG